MEYKNKLMALSAPELFFNFHDLGINLEHIQMDRPLNFHAVQNMAEKKLSRRREGVTPLPFISMN